MSKFSWDGQILSVVCVNDVSCSVDTIMWNSLDGEHLTQIHSGYSKASVLFEDGRTSLSQVTTRLPLFSFIKMPTTIFVCVVNMNCQVTYARQYGIWSRTRIEVTDKGLGESQVKTTYEFLLPGFFRLIRLPLAALIPKWNTKIWNEDLTVKTRREWVTKNGFTDFRGFTEGDSVKQEFFIPIRRVKDSPIHTSPLRASTSRREDLSQSEDVLHIFRVSN